jgi:hypothetical protein
MFRARWVALYLPSEGDQHLLWGRFPNMRYLIRESGQRTSGNLQNNRRVIVKSA